MQIFPISPDINKIVVIQIISYDEFTDVLGDITYNRSKRLTIDIHILEELGYGFSMDHLSGLARIEFINSYPISQIDHPSELIRPGIIKTSNRKTINKELIKKLKEEAGYSCQVCGASEENGATLEIDHIIPVSKGGSNEYENLQVLCATCNRKKGSRIDSKYIG